MRVPTYLDWAASAPLRAEVREAMLDAFDLTGNPSSVHSFGRKARAAVEEARRSVAALAGAKPEQVVFVSGGTEANDLALNGLRSPRHVVSAIEHDSVLQAVGDAEILPARPDGLVDLDALDRMLDVEAGPTLVAVMLVNNETGAIQPIAEIGERVYGAYGWLHVDAVQAAGKLPPETLARGSMSLSLSAHKIGGPKGVGALIMDENTPLRSRLKGGGQERRRRAGTENVSGIVGFGVAAKLALDDLARQDELRALRDGLEERILAVSPNTRVFGRESPRVATISCLTMPGVKSETQVVALDLAGVAVSAGSACSSGKVKPSHVLTAMGASPEEAGSAIRVSLGPTTTAEDIDRFVAAWIALAERAAPRVA